jgi:anti-sigma regulatory factor (Ser/Thr protein kinase)
VTSPPPTNSRHYAVEFQALPSRIGQIRRIVSAQLRYWHLSHLIDPVALGMTELLSNIHRHGTADKHCTVALVLLRDHLTVSVHDHDPVLPRLRTPARFDTSGRGMALVAAVSDDWGMRVRTDGQGKIVWFTLPAALSGAQCGSAAPQPAQVPADT